MHGEHAGGCDRMYGEGMPVDVTECMVRACRWMPASITGPSVLPYLITVRMKGKLKGNVSNQMKLAAAREMRL
jgi:hypothetical protein